MIDRALNAENIAELKKIKNPELNDIVQVRNPPSSSTGNQTITCIFYFYFIKTRD